MNVACLTSGGKDSIYALYVALHYGWNVKCLISIKPKKISWMYHMENIHLIPLISKSMELPLLMKESEAEKEKELNDLKELIEKANVDGVISGAVASEYQRTRIERICHDVGVKSFTPIWHKNEEMLLNDMLNVEFEILITAVAGHGLDERWLGRKIDYETLKEMTELNKKYEVNISGEGGEYETIVVDCPLYKYRIEIEEANVFWDGSRGSYEIRKAKLVKKY
ncbi:MAG TPA: TIGR00289 family protein [Thermoplasmatales archaeon]|nr:TIGR00289 family protein [Thermoplasmatales archaeon]